MTSLDPKIATTQEDGENLEKEERATPQKKRRNQWDQTQADEKKDKTTALDYWDILEEEEIVPQKKRRNGWDQAQADVNKAKTMASDGDLLDVTPTLSLRRSNSLADSNATTVVGKRQQNEITVKSKDIDDVTTKSISDVDSEPFKVEPCRRLSRIKSLRRKCSAVGASLEEGATKNEWFKIQTFDLRGKGGGGGGGGGGSTVGGSGGNGGGGGGSMVGGSGGNGGGGGGSMVGGSGGNGGGTGGQQG